MRNVQEMKTGVSAEEIVTADKLSDQIQKELEKSSGEDVVHNGNIFVPKDLEAQYDYHKRAAEEAKDSALWEKSKARLNRIGGVGATILSTLNALAAVFAESSDGHKVTPVDRAVHGGAAYLGMEAAVSMFDSADEDIRQAKIDERNRRREIGEVRGIVTEGLKRGGAEYDEKMQLQATSEQIAAAHNMMDKKLEERANIRDSMQFHE